MNADVPNLVLDHLRAIREELAGVRTTLAEHGQRLRGIERAFEERTGLLRPPHPRPLSP
ncbi:MAG: hypothetical protein ACK5YI_23430 [Rhodospirillales bacterium]|jgi:hypothetical protein